MTLAHQADLVHAPLKEWAQSRGNVIAIDTGVQALTFSQLYAAVTQRFQEIEQSLAPAITMVEGSLPIVERLVDFLGIIAAYKS